jgi:DNA mismatch repair protein MutS2
LEKGKELDWNLVITEIANFATCESSKTLIHTISPLSTAEEAQNSISQNQLVRQSLVSDLRPNFESLDFFHLWFDRLSKGATLNPSEFRDVRRFCYGVDSLRQLCSKKLNAWQSKTFDSLVDTESILSAIEQIITDDGGIRTDASEELYALYKEKNELERQVHKTLDRIVKDHSMENILRDRYVTTRDGRWVLPVKSGQRSGLNGIIHDISQSKQTVFMEPQEVVDVNNRLRQIMSGIEEEIERILKQLSEFMRERSESLHTSFLVSKQADVSLAIAQFSDKAIANEIEVAGEEIRLKGLRHPLLTIQLGPKNVPNDLVFPNKSKILVLSGPNAGGKTVLLKSLGLAAQMARCGLPVCCAKGSSIPFFKNIVIDVGDSQSVGDNLSTFAAHLKALTRASEAHGSESLILIDEICGSTDPEEGAALARGFVEHFADNGVYALITSHLGPLKQGWDNHRSVISASMEYDEKSHKSTYELVLGLHGRSFAIKTAKVVGVPESIVNRAISFLDPEVRKREMALDEIETIRQETVELRSQLRQEQLAAQADRNRYREMIEKFKFERDEWMKKAIQKAQDKIDEAVRLGQRDKLQIDFRSFKAEMPQVIKSTGNIRRKKARSIAEFQEMHPPGSKVFVNSLSQTAIVQSLPNGKGEVTILSNSMRLSVNWEDIEALATDAVASAPTSKRSSFVDRVLVGGGTRTVDVRGQNVEEALSELEIALDQATLKSEDRIKIIHGHGTEVLKKAIRSYLSRSVYVKKWVAGDKETESDGITWVEL